MEKFYGEFSSLEFLFSRKHFSSKFVQSETMQIRNNKFPKQETIQIQNNEIAPAESTQKPKTLALTTFTSFVQQFGEAFVLHALCE